MRKRQSGGERSDLLCIPHSALHIQGTEMASYPGKHGVERHRGVNSRPFIQPAAAEDTLGGIHRLFETEAARTPEVCAVTHGGHGLTYRALNRRANAFGRRLRDLGVGADVPVGICVGRSIEAVVAVLGVLKAGGAYVPLAPEYPAERLAFMLENSGASVLVADPAAWTQAVPAGVKIVPLQKFRTEDTDTEEGNLPDEVPFTADRLAYIIYTSGSTGRPKGVAMGHRPLLNLLRWQARTVPLAVGARVLQFAPLSFDVSFQEMFSTLGAGGTLALVFDDLRRDPRGLLRFLVEEDIERVFLPPVMLYQLAEQIVHSDFVPTSLRAVIVAGEALRITPAVARFFAGLPGCALHNHYGPTETHVATAYSLTGEPDQWPALPPIGQPIDGVRILIHDDNDRPVPDGEPGGLFLGGHCLARGYQGDPELTAARFVELDGARFYQTGDLVQRGADGVLQFLGRADDQVKIRGFRVELGEIEAVLSRHPAVKETAVGVAPDAAGTAGQELVGYFVPRTGNAVPATADLRRWLLDRMPDYMVPTHFSVLTALPLTPSGKVDRRALPRYEAARAEGKSGGIAPPATPLEKIIARLWEETLAIKNPGVRDNFFEVGGNSLHAVKIHTQLSQALQREFPVTALFEHPTIATLARYLNPEAPASVPPAASPVHDRARRQQQAAAFAAAARARVGAR